MTPVETLERWALELVTTTSLEEKLAPGAPPSAREPTRTSRDPSPGRPPELRVQARQSRKPKGTSSLADPRARARLLHAFFHHELQAAELFAWAVLRFPDVPDALARGWARLACEEIGHARLYRDRLDGLGFAIGAFPVRDWFWQRVRPVESPARFLALVGLGLEGGNLEHARDFAQRFAAANDDESARLQRRIANDEIAHVRFARRWLTELTGDESFAGWAALLPPPTSPGLYRGDTLDREARKSAGLDDAFLDALEASPRPRGHLPARHDGHAR